MLSARREVTVDVHPDRSRSDAEEDSIQEEPRVRCSSSLELGPLMALFDVKEGTLSIDDGSHDYSRVQYHPADAR